MDLFVAVSTQCNQILFLIAARVATELDMVDLEVLHTAAELASPAVALQHMPIQFAIVRRIKPESWALEADGVHEAFCLSPDRKVSCCGLGRKL